MKANAEKPDRIEAERFLALLDPKAEAFTFQTFDDNPDRKNKLLARVLHGSLDQHWAKLCKLNAEGAGVYITINETDLRGRKTENIKRVRATFNDLDGAPLDPVLQSKTPPHLVVQSSPGRFHTYRFDVDDVALDQFTAMQKSSAAQFGGDNVSDLPRVMRLPGFMHRKGAPVMVRIISTEPPAAMPSEPNFFTEYGEQFHEPLDVEQALDEMTFHGKEGDGIDDTETRVSAALLLKYQPVNAAVIERVVDEILEAVKATPGTQDFKWEREATNVRDKCLSWIRKHPEIAELEWLKQKYPKLAKKAASAPRSRLTILNAHEIEAEAIDWIWSNRLARGALTIISGDPGQLKSQITFYCAAQLSTGGQWCDGERAVLGNVYILSAEDTAKTVIVPRLEAAGADLKRVKIIKATVGEHNGKNHYFTLQDDLRLLSEQMKAWGDVALLIVDPVSAFMGSIDSHRTTDVRAVLGPLAEFAEEHNIAVLGIMHPPKAIAGGKAINAISGSLAFGAAARLTFIAMQAPEDEEGVTIDMFDPNSDPNNPRRLLLAVKNNLGPKASGLGYRLGLRYVSKNIEASFVKWDGKAVYVTADDALTSSSGRKDQRLEEAKDWLRGYLAGEAMPTKEVMDAARVQDISERTLDRAKKALHVESVRSGFAGGWLWRLPGQGEIKGAKGAK
jgi:hypothetical protein